MKYYLPGTALNVFYINILNLYAPYVLMFSFNPLRYVIVYQHVTEI